MTCPLFGTYPLHPCLLCHSFLNNAYSLLGFLSNNIQFIPVCKFNLQFFFNANAYTTYFKSFPGSQNIVFIGYMNHHSSLHRQHPGLLFIATLITRQCVGLFVSLSPPLGYTFQRLSTKQVLCNDIFWAPKTKQTIPILASLGMYDIKNYPWHEVYLPKKKKRLCHKLLLKIHPLFLFLKPWSSHHPWASRFWGSSLLAPTFHPTHL